MIHESFGQTENNNLETNELTPDSAQSIQIERVNEEDKQKEIVRREQNRLNQLNEVREKLGLLNKDSIQPTGIRKIILDKVNAGEELSISERIKSGRDRVYTGDDIEGISIKSDHAYRAVDLNTLKKYVHHGNIEGEHEQPDVWTEGGNSGVDWYLGGVAPKYGEYIIEAPANPDKFTIADLHDNSVMSSDLSVRHIKSEGGTNNSVDLSDTNLYKLNKTEEGKLRAESVDVNNI